MNRLVPVVVAGVVGLALFAFDGSLMSLDGTADMEMDYTASPEARLWLLENESESALASNRFGFTKEAIRFVDELYGAGAKRVVVPEDAIEDDGIEVYADSLVVIMPSDAEKRDSVRAICEREMRREGFDPRDSRGADQVYLWWD